MPRIRPRRGPRPGRPHGPRRRLATGLAGLAAGVIIGIAGTAGIVQFTQAPAARVVAQIVLSPLPQFPQWQDAAGTAVMRATASQQLMVVTLHAPRQPGFYAVWLLARDGVSMISLGDLNAGHTGTFVIPPGTDLHNYSYVRISGIVLTLTRAAASALDTTFGTTLFTPGLKLGTASTVLRF